MKKYLLASLITLSSPALAYGADWYVDLASGTVGGTCTETEPCLVVQDVLGAGFAAGDTIYVRGSTNNLYIDSTVLNGTVDQPTVITAWPGESTPTVTGNSIANLVIIAGSYITLDGFEVTDGGVGVEMNNDGGTTSHITLRNFIVRSNTIGINLSEVESVTVENSIIVQNTAQGIDVGESTDVTLINNLISANTNNGLRFMSENTNPAAYHNVISGNGDIGLDIQNLTTDALVYNNILYGNGIAIEYAASALAGADYNDFYANTIISSSYSTLAELQSAFNVEMNSLEVDPAFVDATSAESDFHLQATSPLVDMGYDVSATVVSDVDAETRPYGMGYDIGLDELPVVPTPTTLKVKNISVHRAVVQWKATAGYDVTKYKVEYSRKKSFTKAKRSGTTKTKKTLTKLKAGTRYFVRVKAIYTTDYATYKSAKTSAKKFTTLDLSN